MIYVLQVRGPVETFGEYLVFNDPLSRSRFRTTEFPEAAIKCGSKSAATRFANTWAHALEDVHVVAVRSPEAEEEQHLANEEHRRMVGL